MKLMKILACAIVLSLVASASWSAVKVAPNGKGDVVMYPFFMGAASLETDLTLVNTDQTSSSVAKLVVRSHKYSKELLDFFIYLSPGDVWNGTLKWDAETEEIVMYSEDDSAQSETNTWASPEDPMNIALFDDELELGDPSAAEFGDSKLFGYVYVINAATSSGETDDDTVDDNAPKELVEVGDEEYNVNDSETPKAAVKKWFESLENGELAPETEKGRNTLAGWMDFNLAGTMTSRLEATTLVDYDLGDKPEIGKDTVLGLNDGVNVLDKVEAVLAKTDVVMPYQNTSENYSLHFFTFPTKYSTFASNDDSYEVLSGGAFVRGTDNDQTYPESPFFTNGTITKTTAVDYSDLQELCVEYTPDVYNMKEVKAENPEEIFSPFRADTGLLCSELNFVAASSFEYEEGVAHYAFDSVTDTDESGKLSYTGAPVIPFVMELGSNGLSMSYAAWDDGEVSNDSGKEAIYP